MKRKSLFRETLAQRHEREVSEKLPHGAQTLASGARHEKQDVVTTKSKHNAWWQFLLSLKCTQARSYRCDLDEWAQLVNDTYARSSELRPARAIRIYAASKSPVRNVPVLVDLVELQLDDFIELLTELERLRGLVGSDET